MTKTILDAIQQGDYFFEPDTDHRDEFHQTDALPGTAEKVVILAERILRGEPLWHPEDRLTYDRIDHQN